MHTAIARFLQYLRVERNASDLTVKSYREDLTALADYLTEARGGRCPEPGALDVLELRGYVAALHEAGYAKTTIARRLASLRSFFRFGQREGWAKTNPAKPLRNPRQGPHAAPFPLRRRHRPAALVPARRPAHGPARPRHPGDDVLGRAAGERGGGPGAGRPRLRGRHPPRPRQGTPRAALAHRLLRRPGLAALAGGAAAPSAAARRAAVAGVRQQVRPPADHAERGPDAGKVPPADRPGRPHHAAFAAAQFRHAPAWTAAPTSAACRSCWATRAW